MKNGWTERGFASSTSLSRTRRFCVMFYIYISSFIYRETFAAAGLLREHFVSESLSINASIKMSSSGTLFLDSYARHVLFTPTATWLALSGYMYDFIYAPIKHVALGLTILVVCDCS